MNLCVSENHRLALNLCVSENDGLALNLCVSENHWLALNLCVLLETNPASLMVLSPFNDF